MPESKRLEWDKIGEHFYETGVDKGVLYPFKNGAYVKGVAWNGLTAVNENPSGAEATKLYADNTKYLTLMSAEDFGCTIECYTTPDEFDECDGKAQLVPGLTIGQQSRSIFGFAYRSLLGNDTEGTDYGYEIHLVYGCHAQPSQKNRSTVNDNPEAATMSYEITADPVNVSGFKPTAHVILNSVTLGSDVMAAMENLLWGSENNDPTLPLPDKLKEEIEKVLGA